jgi:carboxymethylenebutenolidase
MLLKEGFVDLDTPTGPMRTHVFRPAGAGRYPGIALFSEIYQVTGPIQRMARRLAGRGLIVAAPEVYHEFEPPGAVFAYDKEGTDKGNRYKIEKPVAAYDRDARAVLRHLAAMPECTGKLGAMGICLGGHLSLRASMNPEVSAGVCFYATDVHSRTLGQGRKDDSLDRLGEIRGEMLMVWGRQDPHIPLEGRRAIHEAMTAAGVDFTWHEFNAQHAFLRDEGARYDPGLAEVGYGMVFELFERRLR